jgi:apolipoprotein N-acyltransferase
LALAASAAGGLLAYLAFPPVGWWPLALVSVAFLYGALQALGAAASYAAATAYGLGLFIPLFAWAEVPAGRAAWLILAAASALLWGLMGLAWAWVRRFGFLARHPLAAAPVFALLWCATEELRARVPFGGFPWGRIAFSQADSPLARLAWAGGVPLVTLVTAWAGACLGVLVLAAAAGRTWLACGAALVAVLAVAGPALVPLDAHAEDGTMAVGAVQGNVPGRESGLTVGEERREVFDNHLAGTYELAEAGEPLDLVVWPEDSADDDPRADAAQGAQLTAAAQAVGAPILIGAQEYPTTDTRYNIALLWDADGAGALGRYAKQHPAPFAEYLPLRSIARKVSSAADLVTVDMLPGTSVGVMEVPAAQLGRTVPVGDVICFEVAYDSLIADAVTAGAELLVVQTNNASFGHSAESVQQLAMTRLRAIEHGRATIQISTTGVSAIISPTGVVLQRTGLWTHETMTQALPLRTSLTPATRWAPRLGLIVLILGGALMVAGLARAVTIGRKARP